MSLTTFLASPLKRDREFLSAEDVSAMLVAANKAREQVLEAWKNCQSDAAHWAYSGEHAYLKALCDILQAAEAVGPDNLPDLPLPRVEGECLMTAISNVREFGEHVLGLAVCDPDKPPKAILKKDGNAWGCLFGPNLQEGVCGFGDTPEAAGESYRQAWREYAKGRMTVTVGTGCSP